MVYGVQGVEGVGNPGDTGVLPVEDHRVSGLGGDVLQQTGGLVDFTEAVQLVAQDIQQEAEAGLHFIDEVHGVGLVKFQNGDVRVEASTPIHVA
ncbi:hypothetical protein D3C73_1281500 [compost metagenome]